MVKVKCSKKKRLATMIQQQSASRGQLPSLSSKEREHGKRRHLSGRRTKAMKTRTHGESDVSSDQDSSDSEGSASSTTDDGSSEEVIAMSQRTKHVHKEKRSKLKRNDSGSKTFPTSCCAVASGRGSLKRVQHLKTLKTINKARLPPALFIGLSDLHVIKLLFVLTGVNPRTRLADFHMADKKEFRLTMRNFYRLCVERCMIRPIERIQPENEKLIAELAESFGWRDEWLLDEELCQKQTEMHAMMTSFAKTQSETLLRPCLLLILLLSRRRRWTKSQTMGMTLCHWAAVFPKESRAKQLLARCVDHVVFSCQMCVMCPLSSFPFRCAVVCVHLTVSSLFPRSFLEVTRDVTLVESESAADEFCSQTAFFVLYELSCFLLLLVWHARCATRGRIERHWR